MPLPLTKLLTTVITFCNNYSTFRQVMVDLESDCGHTLPPGLDEGENFQYGRFSSFHVRRVALYKVGLYKSDTYVNNVLITESVIDYGTGMRINRLYTILSALFSRRVVQWHCL